jgi:hypothetical protein
MPWLTTVTIVGVVVLAALVWLFIRTRSSDLLEEILVKRRASSKAAARADFVEGPNRIPVALAITDDRVCYENPDLDACLELQHIDEVEYDDETSMGQSVEGRVLRIRSHGHGFEFVIESAAVAQFEAALPPRKMGTPQRKAV